MSNIFLHYVLDLWFAKRVKPRARGLCTMVRYADDFVCMTRFPEDAHPPPTREHPENPHPPLKLDLTLIPEILLHLLVG
ncbi:hypothetical protein ACFL02_09000 [Planctomycetota bacterium]